MTCGNATYNTVFLELVKTKAGESMENQLLLGKVFFIETFQVNSSVGSRK